MRQTEWVLLLMAGESQCVECNCFYNCLMPWAPLCRDKEENNRGKPIITTGQVNLGRSD